MEVKWKMTTEVEVICGQKVYNCICVEPVGHEGPHKCHPTLCGGSWTGSVEDSTFKVVTFPLLDL